MELQALGAPRVLALEVEALELGGGVVLLVLEAQVEQDLAEQGLAGWGWAWV